MLDHALAGPERRFKSYWDDWVSAERAQIAQDLGGEKAKPAIFLAKGESEIPIANHVTYYHEVAEEKSGIELQ